MDPKNRLTTGRLANYRPQDFTRLIQRDFDSNIIHVYSRKDQEYCVLLHTTCITGLGVLFAM